MCVNIYVILIIIQFTLVQQSLGSKSDIQLTVYCLFADYCDWFYIIYAQLFTLLRISYVKRKQLKCLYLYYFVIDNNAKLSNKVAHNFFSFRFSFYNLFFSFINLYAINIVSSSWVFFERCVSAQLWC